MKNSDLSEKMISANDLVGYSANEKPVFIGHYWMNGCPERMADNVAARFNYGRFSLLLLVNDE